MKFLRNIVHAVACLTLFASGLGGAVAHRSSESWHDPSPHRVRFVTVDKGVRIEVLDWGGVGRDLLLLAGSGNTAHVYDDFAPKLARFGHVYGMTRRGYGNSTHPESGYSERRLAEDVLEAIRRLHLRKPVLIGHSMSGEELTRLGDEHSKLLGGLIYLDATSDPKDVPADDSAYMDLIRKLPAGMRKGGAKTADDRKSFQALDQWYARRIGVAFPESELRNMYETNPDGSVGKFRTSDRISDLVGAGVEARDYSKISVPILEITPVWKCTQDTGPNYSCIDHPGREPGYQPKNEEERAAIEAFEKADDAYTLRWNKNLMSAKGRARIVDIVGADHYLFLSNGDDILNEVEAFLKDYH